MSVVRETDEAVKATKMEELKGETIPFYMGKLDAMAGENNGYLANGQVNNMAYMQFMHYFPQNCSIHLFKDIIFLSSIADMGRCLFHSTE